MYKQEKSQKISITTSTNRGIYTAFIEIPLELQRAQCLVGSGICAVFCRLRTTGGSEYWETHEHRDLHLRSELPTTQYL